MTPVNHDRPLRGRTVMVTGANGGMGRVIASDLARQGAAVILVVRSARQGEALKREIASATGNLEVDFLMADLSDQASIRQLVSAFHQRYTQLHVLVNNAGIHLQERQLSKDGTEMHFAVNHLAPFLLSNLLLDTLKASAPARIVNVSSQTIADTRPVPLLCQPRPAVLNLDDLQSARDFEPVLAYGRSKLAMVMCGYVLARRLRGSGLSVNALHPGIVATDIVADVAPPLARPFLGLIKRFLLTPEQGAASTVRLASAAELEEVTGKYFVRTHERRSPQGSYDLTMQEQLWDASAALVGLP
ncbi:SDR family NAD(P)-dependent oxidoreductase (plasmid) [Deinococcus radiomollis]|uniref:SDR family NAD(P)-dependent oxidoreductase n=1 Tax=Deinococcus radiomollis TaxID=468916 RepID=UPI0038913FDA